MQKLVNEGEFTIYWVSNVQILVDSIRKALSTKVFRKYQAILEMSIE